MINKLIGCM